MNEKTASDNQAVQALEKAVDRKTVYINGVPQTFLDEMKRAILDQDQIAHRKLAAEAKPIVDLEWFQSTYATSTKLSEFYDFYRKIRP